MERIKNNNYSQSETTVVDIKTRTNLDDSPRIAIKKVPRDKNLENQTVTGVKIKLLPESSLASKETIKIKRAPQTIKMDGSIDILNIKYETKKIPLETEIPKLSNIETIKKNIKKPNIFSDILNYVKRFDVLNKRLKVLDKFKNFIIIMQNFLNILENLRKTYIFSLIYVICFLKIYFILEYDIKILLNNLKDLVANAIELIIDRKERKVKNLEKLQDTFKKVFKNFITLILVVFIFHSILYYFIPIVILFVLEVIDAYDEFFITLSRRFK